METDCIDTGYKCPICHALLDRKQLLEHVCSIRSEESIIYCLSDNDIDSNEKDFTKFYSSINTLNCDTNDDIQQEPYTPLLKNTILPNKPKKDVAMWTDSSTLALLTCYEAKKEDLDHPVKRGKVWALIANDLSELGYKFSAEQVRWKFNTLTRKYKDYVDNSKKTGTGAMTFKFFGHMENILGDRRMVQGQSTISSTFVKSNSKLKLSTTLSPQSVGNMSPQSVGNMSDATFKVQSNASILLSSTSNTRSPDSAKNQIYESPSKSGSRSSKKQALEKVVSSNTETETTWPTSISNTQKNKRSPHGTSSKTAKSKMELEKQWLQHLKNEADREKMRKEKQEAYEKRKVEEMRMKQKLIALKERQLDIKQNTAKRKLEEATEWHRDKLNIEKQKCRLLRELLEARTSSRNKRFKTDTDSECED